MRWLPIAAGVVFLLSLAWLERGRALTGQNDFAQLYAAARLAGTPDLYSRAANLAAIQAIHGFTMESVVYTRPPFYAALLKPLASLPYLSAYALFSLATLSALIWFFVRFGRECPSLPFFAAMSIPAAAALCDGQDTPFLLAIVGATVLLMRRSRLFAAGLVLSLCAIKFHLFLFVPLALLLKRQWRVLAGGILGTALLSLLGVVVNGPDSLRRYVQVLRDPWINPSAATMPNLHGLVAVLHGDMRLELALAGLVLLAFLWLAQRTGDLELLLAASVVCGLLVSFHSGIADDVLLFAVFVAVIGRSVNVPLRAAAALILTPVPYFLVLGGAPWSALFVVGLLALLATFCISLWPVGLEAAPDGI
ncbi:MAG TPA: glycosyltransferase family 87 protein [Bryobacteraceae bacterium]|nr:glycosyltransferase family 87 protein [Bryobacteraceae bacterium]